MQAGMVASFPASWVTTHKGRKASMLVASSCYIVGIIIVTAAVHIAMLIIGRILLGIGVGFAIQVRTSLPRFSTYTHHLLSAWYPTVAEYFVVLMSLRVLVITLIANRKIFTSNVTVIAMWPLDLVA